MFYSPLRYPGGKSRLAKFIAKVCVDNNIDGHYIEPYAGGASVALHLLIEGKVKNITINDYDRSIYAFWYSVLNNTGKLCEMIEDTEINIENWRKAKEVQRNKKKADLLELGFSTFFLNRVNYSGVINGGIIGGISQKGKYKIDCRFNKEELVERIKLIARHKKNIKLYKKDALKLIQKIQEDSDNKNTIFYFDPPYYLKGPSLYMNFYNDKQHAQIASAIKGIKNIHWIVSYDDVTQVNNLYNWARSLKYSLSHFVNNFKVGKEVIFHNQNLKVSTINIP